MLAEGVRPPEVDGLSIVVCCMYGERLITEGGGVCWFESLEVVERLDPLRMDV